MMQFEIPGQKDGRTDRPYFIGSFRLPKIQQEMLLSFMLYYNRSKINYLCLHWQSKIAKCSARLPFKNGGNLVMRFLNFNSLFINLESEMLMFLNEHDISHYKL